MVSLSFFEILLDVLNAYMVRIGKFLHYSTMLNIALIFYLVHALGRE